MKTTLKFEFADFSIEVESNKAKILIRDAQDCVGIDRAVLFQVIKVLHEINKLEQTSSSEVAFDSNAAASWETEQAQARLSEIPF